MDINDATQALSALVSAMNNVSAYDLCKSVYGARTSEPYLEQKAAQLAADGVAWLSNLDTQNRRRLMTIVLARAGHAVDDRRVTT